MASESPTEGSESLSPQHSPRFAIEVHVEAAQMLADKRKAAEKESKQAVGDPRNPADALALGNEAEPAPVKTVDHLALEKGLFRDPFRSPSTSPNSGPDAPAPDTSDEKTVHGDDGLNGLVSGDMGVGLERLLADAYEDAAGDGGPIVVFDDDPPNEDDGGGQGGGDRGESGGGGGDGGGGRGGAQNGAAANLQQDTATEGGTRPRRSLWRRLTGWCRLDCTGVSASDQAHDQQAHDQQVQRASAHQDPAKSIA